MQYLSKKTFHRNTLILPFAILLSGCVANPLVDRTTTKHETPQAPAQQVAPTPKTPVPSKELQSYISTLSMAESPLSSSILEQAMQLSKSGQHQSALEQVALAKTQSSEPTPSLVLTEGVIQYNMGNIDSAEKLFTSLATKYPEFPEGFNNLAVIHAEKGNYPEAIETLQRSFQSHSSYKHIYSNLKALYATLASEAYSKALDLKDQPVGPELLMLNSLTQTAKAPQQVASTFTPLKASTNISAETAAATPKHHKTQTINASVSEAINQHLTDWATAWSEQKSDKYIAAYTDDYRPTPQLTHQQWMAQREIRLSKPQFIRIELSQIKVNVLSDDLVEAYLVQRYESDTYKDAVRKRLMLIKSDEHWKISLEQSLGLVE